MKLGNNGFVVTGEENRGNNAPSNFQILYNLNVTTKQITASAARTLATATVTAAPVLTLSPPAVAMYAGANSALVTITAGAADYDTYVWTPATNLSVMLLQVGYLIL